MSRTRKDRPYWVMKNDPTAERYARHDHLVTLREQIGEEPVYRNVPDKDGWHWKEEVLYMRPIFRTWTETVDCTIDTPEEPVSVWRRKTYARTNEERLAEKNCFHWLEYYPNTRSNKDYKRLTNGAARSKVKQQLHSAVRDYGSWVEYPAWQWYSDDYYDQEFPWPEYIDWEDVDVFVDSKHLSRGWWD